MADSPLVNQKYVLEKFPGKGGWVFARIPEILPDNNAPFGWVRVKGKIDDFEFKNYRLMPMGNGSLFLPVKAEIRKKIAKNEGDWIHVILFEDQNPVEIPEEIILCLKEDPLAFKNFSLYSESEQKMYMDWIYSAKKEETKIERIAKMMDAVVLKRKFQDK
jgi:hypothetical protein